MNSKIVTKIALLKPDKKENGIQWLKLSPGIPPDAGVFIYLCHDLSKPYLFDYWFEDINRAIQWAEEFFGVLPSDWKTVADMRREGFEIID
jgi:hypothetical protein